MCGHLHVRPLTEAVDHVPDSVWRDWLACVGKTSDQKVAVGVVAVLVDYPLSHRHVRFHRLPDDPRHRHRVHLAVRAVTLAAHQDGVLGDIVQLQIGDLCTAEAHCGAEGKNQHLVRFGDGLESPPLLCLDEDAVDLLTLVPHDLRRLVGVAAGEEVDEVPECGHVCPRCGLVHVFEEVPEVVHVVGDDVLQPSVPSAPQEAGDACHAVVDFVGHGGVTHPALVEGSRVVLQLPLEGVPTDDGQDVLGVIRLAFGYRQLTVRIGSAGDEVHEPAEGAQVELAVSVVLAGHLEVQSLDDVLIHILGMTVTEYREHELPAVADASGALDGRLLAVAESDHPRAVALEVGVEVRGQVIRCRAGFRTAGIHCSNEHVPGAHIALPGQRLQLGHPGFKLLLHDRAVILR